MQPQEVQHPDQPMPPVSEFFEREDGDDSDEDEDIVMGGVTQDYKCPLSLTIMVDPLTSYVPSLPPPPCSFLAPPTSSSDSNFTSTLILTD